MSRTALQIGLTGGIGSGKSTVARFLERAGACVVDADAVSRQLTAAGGAALPEIALLFGAPAIGADGAMNRDVVRALVLANPEHRLQLEAIIHPLVRMQTQRLAADAMAAGSVCVVFDVPLLVESARWRPQLDRVVVVDCSPAVQIERVLAREQSRSGWTLEAVERVMAAQASRSHRLSAADICLHNDGISLQALEALTFKLANTFGL